MSAQQHEQQYVLRVQDPELASKLSRALGTGGKLEDLSLEFGDVDRRGTLGLSGKQYDVALQDLPTMVETYVTRDDVNLVKVGDVAQMLLVAPAGSVAASSAPQESADGLTPPMRRARHRHFKPPPDVSAEVMSRVEADLLAILGLNAPHGMEFMDVEEVYVVDPVTKAGSWKPKD